MQKAAEAKGMEADIFAVSASDADNQLESKNVDVLLFRSAASTFYAKSIC